MIAVWGGEHGFDRAFPPAPIHRPPGGGLSPPQESVCRSIRLTVLINRHTERAELAPRRGDAPWGVAEIEILLNRLEALLSEDRFNARVRHLSGAPYGLARRSRNHLPTSAPDQRTRHTPALDLHHREQRESPGF